MKKVIGGILVIGCLFFGGLGASIGNGTLAVIFCVSSLILGIYMFSKGEEDDLKLAEKQFLERKKQNNIISQNSQKTTIQNKNDFNDKKTLATPNEENIKDLKQNVVNHKEVNQNKSLKNDKDLPIKSSEQNDTITENLFVNYNCNIPENAISYPILKIPKEGCIVRTYRIGSTKRRGFKDEAFQNAIEKYFSSDFLISGNVRLNTGKDTRPFEPDISIIDLNTNHNIRIDVEIDEPYAGISRQATHCKGDDINRDNYFIVRGWIVVRFSEYQVHTQELECLKYLAKLINSLNPKIKIPTDLMNDVPINENLWDIVQAQKWEKIKYRETYLNHTFSIIEEKSETTKRDFSKQEIQEEKLVKNIFLGNLPDEKELSFNKINYHKRDKRIKFYSENHIYTIDGVPAPSASTIISRFFPEFDSVYWAEHKSSSLGMTPYEVEKMWNDNGKTSRDKGTYLHEQIENYYLGKSYSETEEFEQFQQFTNNHSNLNPYRSEWRIFDENFNIAGTIDLLVKNTENSYDIYDWKRSKKVVNSFDGMPITNNQWQKGIGNLNNIDDTSYNRYSLQQSLYRYILETNYEIKINNMYLIVMHPEYNNYFKLSVPYLKEEIEYILKTL